MKERFGILMIRLRSLAISQFRGIREGKIDGLTDVNLLVGRNNSGKTTVIEAITRAMTIGGFQQDLFGRGVEQVWQAARPNLPGGLGTPLLWYRQDASKEISIIASIQQQNGGTRTDALTYRLEQVGHSPVVPGGWHPDTRIQLFCARATVFRPADAFNSFVEQSYWAQLLSNRRDRLLTQALNDVFGLDAESFQLLPNSQFMVLFRDHSIPFDLQGDGTRAAMRTMMTLALLQGTLLMLEEPECHQHPGSLERFAAALCRLAKTQDVQLIVSTHSGECVRSFLKAAQDAASDAAVFHLTLDDGKQESRRLDPEAVESLTATGVDVRFLDLYA